MRTTELRVGGGLAVIVALGALIGCGGGSSTNPNVQVDPGKKNGSGPGDKKSPQAEMTVIDFAKAFLQSIREGNSRPDVFAPEFLRVVARPISDEDKKLGYNAVVARNWLASLGPAEFKVVDQHHSSVAATQEKEGWAYLRGSVSGAKPGHFGVVCLGGSGKYLVAWFYRSPVTASAVPTSGASYPALATGVAFCDCLIGDELPVAEALMTTPLKASIADPLKSDADIGYNPGFLKAKLRSAWKGDATGYKLTKQDVAADGMSSTLTGELTAAGGAKPFTLSLTKDAATGLWLVSAFKTN